MADPTAGHIGLVYLQAPKDPANLFVASEGRLSLYQEASLDILQNSGQVSKIDVMSSGAYYSNSHIGDIVITVIHGDGRTGVDAECTPVLGATTQYRGYFTTTRGFLSSDKYLQDETMYNDYTYMIRVSESFERYSHLIRHLIHPAGFQLIGRFVATFDAGADAGGFSAFIVDEADVRFQTLGRLGSVIMTAPGFEDATGQVSFAELTVPDSP